MVCRASLGRFARTSKCGGVLSVVGAAWRRSWPVSESSVVHTPESPEPTIRPATWQQAVGSGDSVRLPRERP
jgi:hypothetical protein